LELKRSQTIEAPHQKVWEALNDIEILKASIPGCESLERTDDDTLRAVVKLKVGPIGARFNGIVKFSDVNPPDSYTLTFEGQGGAAGFAKGNAQVSLRPEGPDVTILDYETKAQVGGKLAQLGARLIDSAAIKTSTEFFDNFSKVLATQTEVEAKAETPVEAAAAQAAEPRPVVSDTNESVPGSFNKPLVYGVGALVVLVLVFYAFT